MNMTLTLPFRLLMEKMTIAAILSSKTDRKYYRKLLFELSWPFLVTTSLSLNGLHKINNWRELHCTWRSPEWITTVAVLKQHATSAMQHALVWTIIGQYWKTWTFEPDYHNKLSVTDSPWLDKDRYNTAHHRQTAIQRFTNGKITIILLPISLFGRH